MSIPNNGLKIGDGETLFDIWGERFIRCANDEFRTVEWKEVTDMAKAQKKWIQKAVNPKHKGYCTPTSKATCTPRRKALAMRFKKGDLHR